MENMMSLIFPVVIGVVRNSNGNILLSKRHQPEIPNIHGKWNLLGGKLEFGETPEQALVREVKEESGLDIEVIKVIPKIFTRIFNKNDGSKFQIVTINYECMVVGGILHDPVQDKRVSELRFFEYSEIDPSELIEETELTIIQLALEK